MTLQQVPWAVVPDARLPLAGRRALVTGAAGGIGAAVARELASRGAELVLADLDGARAEALAGELRSGPSGVGTRAWAVDLGDTARLTDERLAGALGDVDILVNNAGVQHISPIEDFDPVEFRRILSIMLEAPFLLVRAALPGMYRRGFGRIINVSSVHGVRASAFKSAYVTAKHGLEGFSKATALEGAPHGVTSVCVNPGYVRTPLVERQLAQQAEAHGVSVEEVLERILLADAAIKRLVEPSEVASLVAWLASDDAAMATGSSYLLDGGWSAH
ncbi:3-hydroxybutyrate dehydrogenase [Herbiconiux sp. CPCC 205716]|uniref:3-hydroxybutyrate dehydrogenase n=1 Tax=Herbiconiux gentiana TaxID=2970912 RepID=A0ABT2GIR3_9MICO|nr:3-hydroxybutyrate dehydrogenase [Herbiconiux gentiana]MCS5714661.1 3-hydroxybutyrate dehydrogenase [Herbiconiux gentiana]